MTNEFLEAAKDSSDEDSEKRYRKLKKEEAGTEHQDMAEKRYQELKEKAKEKFAEKQEADQEDQDKNEDESSDDGSEGFVTY
ncbi:MAG: hypothetical protein ACI8Z7_000714 [Candidatus Nanohaloarchaea archaeon]|jgi:hypothetical protein